MRGRAKKASEYIGIARVALRALLRLARKYKFASGMFVFLVLMLFIRDSSWNCAYRARTPEELKYLAMLKSRYSEPSRKLDVVQVSKIVENACRFIDSALGKRDAFYDGNVAVLLLGTAAVESDFKPRFQASGGDAIGLFQVEYGTFRDLWNRVIKNKYPALYSAVLKRYGDAAGALKFEELQKSDELCAVFARIKYAESGKPVPEASDTAALARYYKRVYNTLHGAAKEKDFIKKLKLHMNIGKK